MSGDVEVTLTYTEGEARAVISAIAYYVSNVDALDADQDRMVLISSAIAGSIPRPRPAEPTGLGAVVEDADGKRWVRTNAPYYPWSDEPHDDDGWECLLYSDISAVRVLSEGVTA